VLGDALATDIILGQLLENAFKYSPRGGLISVGAWPEEDNVVVVVDDEGIGIAPPDRERIFERFVQVDSGDRRRFGGVGLGLYIVRSLARAQGGDVSAHPRPEGGTRMRLVLRCAVPIRSDTPMR
jgi:signal transduction histidine kinase